MPRKSVGGICAISILGLLAALAAVPASAAVGGVTISWTTSQRASLGDNIKKAAHRLGKTAHHDFPIDCREYGTFTKRQVTFHTSTWPKIDSIYTYSNKVRLRYGIRVGQTIKRAKALLPERYQWQGPIKALKRDFQTRVWYVPRPHHRVLMISGGRHVTWLGTFASKQAIEMVMYEDC